MEKLNSLATQATPIEGELEGPGVSPNVVNPTIVFFLQSAGLLSVEQMNEVLCRSFENNACPSMVVRSQLESTLQRNDPLKRTARQIIEASK